MSAGYMKPGPKATGGRWEQHVRHPHFQQFRGHHSVCWNVVMQTSRTRRIRFFGAERL